MTDPERYPITHSIETGHFARLAAVIQRSGQGILGMLVLVGLVALLMPGSAWALPEGRVYEMVSPLYKGGFGVIHIEAASPDGESVAFYSPGVFAGAPSALTNLASMNYVARRTPSGWSTTPLLPPAALAPWVNGQDVSSTLETTIDLGKPASSVEAAGLIGSQEEVLSRSVASPDTQASWQDSKYVFEALEKSSITLDEGAASADLCHLVLEENSGEGQGRQLLPEAAEAKGAGLNDQPYEFDRGCAGRPSALRVLGLNNAHQLINPSCAVEVGISNYARTTGRRASRFNAMSVGGGETFFTLAPDSGKGCEPHQLFVRIGGVHTLEVSRPLGTACEEVPCSGAGKRASAYFVGASNDGSRVFFEAEAYPGEGTGNELYMATISCAAGSGEACAPNEASVTSMAQASHDPHAGEAADVQGVVRVAPDGSRVYFVAQGALTEAPNAEGHMPVKGADNLYVYDATSGVSYIADLCSGYELSGSVADSRCPDAEQDDVLLWRPEDDEAQTAGVDGSYLVFSSAGQLTPDDTDAAPDVYRYDAGTGRLERVSIGEHGYDANGNNSAFAAHIKPSDWGEGTVRAHEEMGSRTVDEEGSRIIFTTAEPLSPNAGDLTSLYEWHSQPGIEGGGEVALVSGGDAAEPVEDAVISATGNDIFFITSQGLVPQDTDGAPDLYDARLGGGFASVPAEPLPCSSDACQGPLTNPTPLLVPASAVQAPGEDLSPPTTTVKAKPKAKTKAKSKKKTKPSKNYAKGRKSSKAREKGKKSSVRGKG